MSVVPLRQSEDKRNRSRRGISKSERVVCLMQFKDKNLRGHIISVSPGGMALVVSDSDAKDFTLTVGDRLEGLIEMSGLDPLSMNFQISNIAKFDTESIRGFRIGMSIVKSENLEKTEKRKSKRFPVSEFLRPSVSFENPIFEYSMIYAKVTDIGLNSMQCETSSRNNSVLPGMKLRFTINFPILGTMQVTGKIVNYLPHPYDDTKVVFGVKVESNQQDFQSMCSELLVMANSEVSTSVLQEEGFYISSIARGVSFEYAFTKEDLKQVAALRLKAWQKKGYFDGVVDDSTMFDKYDKHSRHMVAKVNGKIVASARLVYNNGLKERCEHMQYNADIPSWLWEAGFVETSRLVTDPEYRGGDLFLMMTQQIGKTVLQSGYQYMVSSCEPSLEKIYTMSGCRRLNTFTTPESKDPWCLLVMDVGTTIKGIGMNPVFWNIVHKPITQFLIKRNFIQTSAFERFWLATYNLFGPLSKLIVRYKSQRRSKKKTTLDAVKKAA